MSANSELNFGKPPHDIATVSPQHVTLDKDPEMTKPPDTCSHLPGFKVTSHHLTAFVRAAETCCLSQNTSGSSCSSALTSSACLRTPDQTAGMAAWGWVVLPQVPQRTHAEESLAVRWKFLDGVLQILANGNKVGTLSRNLGPAVTLDFVPLENGEVVLDVIVEELGRDNGGTAWDLKGLMSGNITLDGAL